MTAATLFNTGSLKTTADIDDYRLLTAKVIVLGDDCVGKSAVLTRFVDDSFGQCFQATIGFDLISKTVYLDSGHSVRLLLWDTAGQERFLSVILPHIRFCGVALIMYDIMRDKTLVSATEWVKRIMEVRGNSVRVILVGNKMDLSENRQVSRDEGEEKARLFESLLGTPVPFYETSAKTGDNVAEIFRAIASEIVKDRKTTPTPQIVSVYNETPATVRACWRWRCW